MTKKNLLSIARAKTAGIAFSSLLIFATWFSTAFALEPLPPPQGKVILVISGNIEIKNAGDTAQFDREMLTAMGMTTIETLTSWTDGIQVFEGVLARNVLNRVGASGTIVIATALNDFVAPVPMRELQEYDVILATIMNGREMAISDKGPIWIVYPRNDNPELQDPKYNDRWVWQLRELRVQ